MFLGWHQPTCLTGLTTKSAQFKAALKRYFYSVDEFLVLQITQDVHSGFLVFIYYK
jgi:hypothetical protein